MADRFRSLPPGGMAPSRANVGSRQEGRRRGEIASSDVGDEAVFQAAPEVSQRLPRGRRPDPRDEREEARRFASVNLPSQRVREMADMTTTDDDATLDRRRRREEKFQGPVRTRAPPGTHNYESRPRVLHHDSDEDDRRGRYTSENSARRRANDDRRAYASTGAPMRGSDRRDDERDALRGPSSVTWNSSTPLRPRTRQTDGAPSTRGTRDAPSGNRRTRDSSSERPARADSDAPFRGVDSQLYGRKPEGRRAPAPSGRSPRGSRRKASPPRNWRDEEGSLPSSDESSSGSEQVRMSPVRRRPNGNPSRSPSPSSSTDGSVVSSSSSGTGRHDSDSDSDNTNDRRRAGNNLGGGEMTATAAGRRRRRLPGDLVADVEPARSRRERSDEDTDGSGKETQKEKKDPDSALTAGGAGSAEREQSADHEGSDSSSSEEGGRRRASNAPIFIENARTGKFSRLGYKDAQKEQRRRNQRAQADDQPRTVEQSVAALVSGLHILVFFISGLIAGMALLNTFVVRQILSETKDQLNDFGRISMPIDNLADGMHSLEAEFPSFPDGGVELPKDDLDLLAVLMSVMKILFVAGQLRFAHDIFLPLVDAVAEAQKDVHLTKIRNENAYFKCVAALLRVRYSSGSAIPSADTDSAPIFMCGDSHSLSSAWQVAKIRGQRRWVRPALVTGLKCWHLRPESDFFPKIEFQTTVASLPDGADVAFLFGEIDCREGFLRSLQHGRYESLEEGARVAVKIYSDTLQSLARERKFTVFVHPVPPTLDVTRKLVVVFQQELEKALANGTTAARKLTLLPFFDGILTPSSAPREDRKLKKEYELDGTHLHPSYVPELLEPALEMATTQ